MTGFFLTHEMAVGIVCAAACVLTVTSAVRAKLGWLAGVWMSAFSLILCLLGARGYYIAVADLTGAGYWGPFFSELPYDYAFGGGVLGFLAALALTSVLTRQPFDRTADAFVPAGLAAVAGLRLAEALSDFGWGDIVDAAWMQRYPFAIQNMYEEWCAAVFNLEALCALAVLAAVLLCGERLKGRRLLTALTWWAVTQIFCESLRVESIQWGFVRVQQLFSAVTVAAVILIGTIRLKGAQRKRCIPSWIAFAACIGAVIFLEYALDKLPFPVWLDYAAMAAVLGVLGWSAQRITAEVRK